MSPAQMGNKDESRPDCGNPAGSRRVPISRILQLLTRFRPGPADRSRVPGFRARARLRSQRRHNSQAAPAIDLSAQVLEIRLVLTAPLPASDLINGPAVGAEVNFSPPSTHPASDAGDIQSDVIPAFDASTSNAANHEFSIVDRGNADWEPPGVPGAPNFDFTVSYGGSTSDAPSHSRLSHSVSAGRVGNSLTIASGPVMGARANATRILGSSSLTVSGDVPSSISPISNGSLRDGGTALNAVSAGDTGIPAPSSEDLPEPAPTGPLESSQTGTEPEQVDSVADPATTMARADGARTNFSTLFPRPGQMMSERLLTAASAGAASGRGDATEIIEDHTWPFLASLAWHSPEIAFGDPGSRTHHVRDSAAPFTSTEVSSGSGLDISGILAIHDLVLIDAGSLPEMLAASGMGIEFSGAIETSLPAAVPVTDAPAAPISTARSTRSGSATVRQYQDEDRIAAHGSVADCAERPEFFPGPVQRDDGYPRELKYVLNPRAPPHRARDPEVRVVVESAPALLLMRLRYSIAPRGPSLETAPAQSPECLSFSGPRVSPEGCATQQVC
jgi:hypothetical protein